jgi:diacylglycerol kinase
MVVKRNFLSFMRGFVYASKGLIESVKTQFNIRFHFIATALVIYLGFHYHLSPVEWCLILISIAIMLTSELLNTAIEYLTDFVSPEYNDLAGKVKDIASAAVLIAAVISATIGVIIFLPKIA